MRAMMVAVMAIGLSGPAYAQSSDEILISGCERKLITGFIVPESYRRVDAYVAKEEIPPRDWRLWLYGEERQAEAEQEKFSDKAMRESGLKPTGFTINILFDARTASGRTVRDARSCWFASLDGSVTAFSGAMVRLKD